MASYRPKSLDELNNMYDKAISAEQAIQREASKLSVKGAEAGTEGSKASPQQTTASDTPTPRSKANEADKPIEDLSGAVDDFIRHFSSKASLPSQQSSSSAGKAPVRPSRVYDPYRAGTGHTAKPAVQKSSHAEGMSELMSDYVKIMTDQDDESERKNNLRRRKKDRKKAASAEQRDLPDAEELDKLMLRATEEENSADTDNEHELTADETPQMPQENELYDDMPFPSLEEDEKEDDATVPQEKSTVKKGSGVRIFFRTILSILLVICIAAAAAAASLSVVFKVNSGTTALTGQYFFTASYDFADVSVKKGDLILCTPNNIIPDGEKVVYIDRESKQFSFGIKNGGFSGSGSEITYFVSGKEVNRDDIAGTIAKTIPTAGAVIDLVLSEYIVSLVVIFALVVILLLIVGIGLRNRSGSAADRKREKEKKKIAKRMSEDDTPEESEELPIPFDDTSTESVQDDIPDDSSSLFSDL